MRSWHAPHKRNANCPPHTHMRYCCYPCCCLHTPACTPPARSWCLWRPRRATSWWATIPPPTATARRVEGWGQVQGQGGGRGRAAAGAGHGGLLNAAGFPPVPSSITLCTAAGLSRPPLLVGPPCLLLSAGLHLCVPQGRQEESARGAGCPRSQRSPCRCRPGRRRRWHYRTSRRHHGPTRPHCL
jgi:hypothetical protein